MTQAKKEKSPNILELLIPYKFIIISLLVFAVLSNAVNLILPKLIATAIDSFSEGNFSYQQLIVNFFVAATAIFILTFLQGILQTYASEKVALDLRSQLIHKISQQSFAFIQEANPSKLLTNLTSDIDSIKLFVSLSLVSLVSSVFIIVATSTILLLINWELALPILVIIPIIISVFFIIFKRLGSLFKKSREAIDWLNKVLNESIMGAMIIRVLNSQAQEYYKFMEANTHARNLGISILKLFATLIPIVVFISNLASLIILALGGRYVITGNMSLGDFAAFNAYLVLLIFPILVIGFISNFIVQASVAYKRIHSVLNAEDTDEKEKIERQISGSLELNNIVVRYGNKSVLNNVSLSIKSGTKTAIIGPMGAGKSQLLYLLAGLTKVTDGSILFDGISIDEYKKSSFQHQIGFVFQDSIIFNMSLRENIAFNGSVSNERMQKAISTAELNELIESLPQGIETIVSERGNSLSGGQKQRIMLARALALNPTLLLLDDFTARVDHPTEQLILENISNNYPDITLLSVTQNIDSIKDYPQIILMENGEILATGTHDYLVNTSPEYVQIYNSQRSINVL
jgi:ATP-binding cassette subfamily B protein